MLALLKSRKFQVAVAALAVVIGGHFGLPADVTQYVDPLVSLLAGIFLGKPAAAGGDAEQAPSE